MTLIKFKAPLLASDFPLLSESNFSTIEVDSEPGFFIGSFAELPSSDLQIKYSMTYGASVDSQAMQINDKISQVVIARRWIKDNWASLTTREQMFVKAVGQHLIS